MLIARPLGKTILVNLPLIAVVSVRLKLAALDGAHDGPAAAAGTFRGFVRRDGGHGWAFSMGVAHGHYAHGGVNLRSLRVA